MPAFNAERHIRAAIESILSQTMTDLELVICDNGSTDATATICREYAARDPRVRFFRNERNLGAAENYNRVLREARASLFKWSSSNDVCAPEFLSACVDGLDQRPDAVLVYPTTILFTTTPESGRLYRDALPLDSDDPVHRFLSFVDRLGLNNAMNGVIRVDALNRVPPNKPYVSSDLVTTCALTLYGKFVELEAPLFYRRMDAASATKYRGEEGVYEHFDPQGDRRMLFQLWRLQLEYLAVALTAGPISARQRLVLVGGLLRRMLSARDKLWADVSHSFRRLVARRRLGHGG